MLKIFKRYGLNIITTLCVSVSLGLVLYYFLHVKNVIVLTVLTVIITLGVGILSFLQDFVLNRELTDELRRQTKIRSSILNLAQNMTMIHSRTKLYEMILQTAVEVMPFATMGSIMSLDDDNKIKFESVVGFDLVELQGVTLTLEETYIYNLTQGKLDKTVVVNNAQQVNRELSGEGNIEMAETTNTDLINSTISAPLYIDGKLYGMMNVDSTIENAFNEIDVDLIIFFANEAIKVIKLYDTIEENNRLSKFDPLTNLYNRRYLHHRLEAFTKENNVFTLVSIDINNLKMVNDKYGHDLGDELLMGFVKGIKQNLGKNDLFSRYGGDEFIVVHKEKSKSQVETLYKDIILPYFTSQEINEVMPEVRVTFSFGMTTFPDDAKDYEKLMLKADQLMYMVKRSFHAKKLLDKENSNG